ncbi:DUF6527 family protein [Burkholderia cepacia]|uniref:DUF6527 family protein n=2 Tax=Burkholderia cepacia TaxID=292 RepID=UPI000ABBCCA1|nr:DUF6527 family protein [Burkholderia cepacia]MCA8464968.1 hypothetical protein [Burkholderia cepacia]
MKLEEQKHDNGTRSMLFECPDCDMLRIVYLEDGRPNSRPMWQWNGSMDRPTFAPSLLPLPMGRQPGGVRLPFVRARRTHSIPR